MISSDFRAEARRKLSGKWGKAVCIILAYLAFAFVLGFIEGLFPDSMESVFSIISIVIEIPLSFGIIIAFVKLFNEEEVKAFDFLSLGFSNFKKSWGIAFQTFLKMIVPTILVIISYFIMAFGISMMFTSMATSAFWGAESNSSGFSILIIVGVILLLVSSIWATTKSYYYKLAYILAAENPELSSKEAVLKSEELMTGNRAKLFFLELSFIGWIILSAFTFGIGLLWVVPYIQFATIAFYKFLNGDNSNVKAEVITENNNPI